MSGFRPILPKEKPDSKPFHVTTLASLLPEAKSDTETCRLCLSRGHNFVRVLEPYQLGLADLIKECVSIEIKKTDLLPTVICNQCKTKVMRWSKFRDNCFNTNKYLVGVLAEVLTNNVTPPVDEDDAVDESSADENNKFIEDDAHDDTVMDRRHETYSDDGAHEGDSKIIIEEDLICQDDGNTDGNTDPQQCVICFKLFTSLLDLLDHQKTHEGQAVFICESCPKTFLHKRDLVRHERNHPIPCPKCDKMIGKLNMKLHTIWHSDKYKCKLCPVRCSSSYALNTHIKARHARIRDRVCEICGKTFSTADALNIHHKAHKNRRAYKCERCAYTSNTASGVASHMSVHARDRLRCDSCPGVFKSARNLKTKTKTRTG